MDLTLNKQQWLICHKTQPAFILLCKLHIVYTSLPQKFGLMMSLQGWSITSFATVHNCSKMRLK